MTVDLQLYPSMISFYWWYIWIIMASSKDLQTDWDFLCQECTDCWTKNGEPIWLFIQFSQLTRCIIIHPRIRENRTGMHECTGYRWIFVPLFSCPERKMEIFAQQGIILVRNLINHSTPVFVLYFDGTWVLFFFLFYRPTISIWFRIFNKIVEPVINDSNSNGMIC